MKTIFFLGAGASKSEGAPLQSELFYEYFKEFANRKDDYYILLKDFFSKTYKIDVETTKLYPTFEEILGLLYIAEKRQVSFYFNVEEVKKAIVYSMAEILDKKLVNLYGYHYKFIKNLIKLDKLKNVVLITTNYDILIDNALILNNVNIDYGIKIIKNYNNLFNLPLLKIYGAINWMFCDVCDEFKIVPFKDGALRNIINGDIRCSRCNNKFKSIIVPPTFFKDISNPYLNNVYHHMNKYLYENNKIVFCGYSLPDADLYVKFIIKRAELYKEKSFDITVINGYEEKSLENMKKECNRYNMFFNNQVNYLELSFQDFINSPKMISKLT